MSISFVQVGSGTGLEEFGRMFSAGVFEGMDLATKNRRIELDAAMAQDRLTLDYAELEERKNRHLQDELFKGVAAARDIAARRALMRAAGVDFNDPLMQAAEMGEAGTAGRALTMANERFGEQQKVSRQHELIDEAISSNPDQFSPAAIQQMRRLADMGQQVIKPIGITPQGVQFGMNAGAAADPNKGVNAQATAAEKMAGVLRDQFKEGEANDVNFKNTPEGQRLMGQIKKLDDQVLDFRSQAASTLGVNVPYQQGPKAAHAKPGEVPEWKRQEAQAQGMAGGKKPSAAPAGGDQLDALIDQAIEALGDDATEDEIAEWIEQNGD